MPKMVKFSSTDLLHAIREIPADILSSTEKLILYTLLACLNADNETWHSLESIANFASLCERTLNRKIKLLEQKGFIKVNRPAHYTHRSTNRYCANLEQIMSYHVTKSPDSMSPDLSISPDIESPNIDIGRHTVTQSPDTKSGDRLTQSRTKKDIKKEIKKERATLSFFEPDEQNQKLAAELGLNLEEQCESFIQLATNHTQYGFKRWLEKGHDYLIKQRTSQKTPVVEIRSTVQEWAPGHPGYDSLHGVRRNAETPPRANGIDQSGSNSVRHASAFVLPRNGLG